MNHLPAIDVQGVNHSLWVSRTQGWRMKVSPASTRHLPPQTKERQSTRATGRSEGEGLMGFSRRLCETWIPYKIHGSTKPVEMGVGLLDLLGIQESIPLRWGCPITETKRRGFFSGSMKKPFWEGEPGSLGYGMRCFLGKFSGGRCFLYKLTHEFKIAWTWWNPQRRRMDLIKGALHGVTMFLFGKLEGQPLKCHLVILVRA